MTVEQKEEFLRQLLNKIAKENKYVNYELIINKISSGGANYTSKLFTVIIREENKEDLHLFAKIAAVGEAMRSEFPVEIYDNEIFFYTKLSKIYESLEEENGVPEEHRLHFTKCYGYDATKNQELLVLENLLALGYGPHDRFHSYDWEYASSAVTDLAKLHALSFAFSEKNPEEFEKTLAVLKVDWKENQTFDVMIKSMLNVAVSNVNPKYRHALEKFMKDAPPPFVMTAANRKPTIIHADFRGNNLLHKVREDGKVEIKILDLQTLQLGSPVIDLIYFIVSGSDEVFRAKYYEKLLEHYYTQLSAAMKRLHLDPEKTYSREDFNYELKEKIPYAVMVAVVLLPLVTVDSKDAPEVNESMDVSSFVIDKPSDLYVKRLNGFINDFVKWGVLKLEPEPKKRKNTMCICF